MINNTNNNNTNIVNCITMTTTPEKILWLIYGLQLISVYSEVFQIKFFFKVSYSGCHKTGKINSFMNLKKTHVCCVEHTK